MGSRLTATKKRKQKSLQTIKMYDPLIFLLFQKDIIDQTHLKFCKVKFPTKNTEQIYSTKSLCKCSFSSKHSLTFDVTKIIGTLVAQMVKHLSTMRETWFQSLGWEDALEKEMAIHSSTIAWKIPWTEEPGGCSQTRLIN